MKGCQRLKSEVVAEHEASKAHREAEEAEKIRVSVQTQGGLFRRQMRSMTRRCHNHSNANVALACEGECCSLD